MKCQRCGSDRIINVNGKCSDLCSVIYKGLEHDGHVPAGIGLQDEGAWGDFVIIEYCLECGQMQGQFPVAEETVVRALSKE